METHTGPLTITVCIFSLQKKKKKKETFTQHLTQADRWDVDESEREESRIKAKFLIWATWWCHSLRCKNSRSEQSLLRFFWSGRWKWKSCCAHENFENPIIHSNRSSMKSWYYSRAKYIKNSWVIVWFWHLKKNDVPHFSAVQPELRFLGQIMVLLKWSGIWLVLRQRRSIPFWTCEKEEMTLSWDPGNLTSSLI